MTDDVVAAHAAKVRQSLQMCTSHLAGPVLAWAATVDMLGDDAIHVGRRIVADSEQRLRDLFAQGHVADDREVRREQLTIRFAHALFIEGRTQQCNCQTTQPTGD